MTGPTTIGAVTEFADARSPLRDSGAQASDSRGGGQRPACYAGCHTQERGRARWEAL